MAPKCVCLRTGVGYPKLCVYVCVFFCVLLCLSLSIQRKQYFFFFQWFVFALTMTLFLHYHSKRMCPPLALGYITKIKRIAAFFPNSPNVTIHFTPPLPLTPAALSYQEACLLKDGLALLASCAAHHSTPYHTIFCAKIILTKHQPHTIPHHSLPDHTTTSPCKQAHPLRLMPSCQSSLQSGATR